jgi:hypothetical protein
MGICGILPIFGYDPKVTPSPLFPMETFLSKEVRYFLSNLYFKSHKSLIRVASLLLLYFVVLMIQQNIYGAIVW